MKVSWDYEPKKWKHKIHVPNHQLHYVIQLLTMGQRKTTLDNSGVHWAIGLIQGWTAHLSDQQIFHSKYVGNFRSDYLNYKPSFILQLLGR
jgi:hypothetical protein